MTTATTVMPARDVANGISDSTLSLIPGAGHFSMLDNPVAFNRILRNFLDGLPRGAS